MLIQRLSSVQVTVLKTHLAPGKSPLECKSEKVCLHCLKRGLISISEVHTIARSSSRSVHSACLGPLAAFTISVVGILLKRELTSDIVYGVVFELH